LSELKIAKITELAGINSKFITTLINDKLFLIFKLMYPYLGGDEGQNLDLNVFGRWSNKKIYLR